MPTWYAANLTAHVVAGALGLLTMLVPLLARKGGRLHRRAGWVFVVAMGLASITGLVIGLSWLAAPLTVRPPSRPLDPEEAAAYASSLREMGLFFTFIGVLVGSSLWHGIVALRQRTGKIAWGNPIDLGLAWISIALGSVLLVVGTLDFNPVLLGFGVLGTFGGISDLRFHRRETHERGAWLFRHLQAMLGGATAATTAFTVQFVGRALTEGGYGSGWLLAAWGLPPALGILATHLWTRRVRRDGSSPRPGYTRG